SLNLMFFTLAMFQQPLRLILYNVAVLAMLAVLFKFLKRITVICKIRWNLRTEWKGPPCHWFWGHLGQVTKGNKDPANFIPYFTKNEKLFPFGFAIYAGPLRTILTIHHPNLVKQVLNASTFDAPKPKEAYGGLLLKWLGLGLLSLNNREWFRHRKLLTSAFHHDILKPYVKISNSCTDILLDTWQKKVKQQPTGFSIEIFEQASLLTLDIALQCLMSYESKCQERLDNDYISSIKNLSFLYVRRNRSKNLLLKYFPFLYKWSQEGKLYYKECDSVHKFSTSLINRRKQELGNPDIAPKREFLDFLDMLLQARDSNGLGLTTSEICAEVDTFLFGSHDTTASGISWFLYCISQNPEEITQVLGDRENVRWSDLSSLPYLTRCIKETLRLYPPAPYISRTVNKDIYAEGKTILKGTTVLLSIIGVQRSVLFWKHPQKFNPDRFTPESASMQNNHAFIPFSAGPRNCIGQHFAMNEMRVVLSKMLRTFRFSIDPNHKIVPCHEIIYRSRGGIHLIVEPRTSVS
uniref:Uncharacterized protein n=1 Tax=Ciona savignyi TaxID=51511 RepID=H2ZLS1_CIOSA